MEVLVTEMRHRAVVLKGEQIISQHEGKGQVRQGELGYSYIHTFKHL